MTNSNKWKSDPEYIELMNFLIERTKKAKSPLGINTLAREFKEKSGSYQTISCLLYRIRSLREKAIRLDTIDTVTKVKMMFALSVSIDENVLKRLKKNADVEIDGNNRITKYRAKDGSLELTGDHSQSAKMKEALKPDPMDSEDDGSKIPIQKTSGSTPGSMKRPAVEVPNPFKRKKVKSEDSAPDDFEGFLDFRAREPEPPLLRQPKLEEAPGAPTRPKYGSNDAHTPQIKLLRAMKFLITPLDLPSLSPLLTKIEKKFLESSPNSMIPNNEMILGMAVLVTKITNHSMPIQAETGKSVSLKEFLCYLKAAIMNSKLEGLEGLLEKIRGRIEELAFEDKKIPVEKVASALQATLGVIGF